nr:pentatricopeptide repeat-containing protein At3g49240, mitochondrial [Quercus suber]POE50177.1 pentatricopeptide repeat-containing protein [Quercus suber]
MALSKLTQIRILARPTYPHHPPPQSTFISFRSLSFSSPEEAAAERRRRKRRLRIEPPLSSLNRSQQQQPQQPQKSQIPQNPNSPKLPEHVSALSGNRLNLHNRILTLIRQNDLEEASLFTRHSVYSNCRPTIFTVNSVLFGLLRQSKYSDLLSLHRFITQAGIAPNVITYNLLFQTYLDCRKPDTALEHFRQFTNDAPINPSPTTYRILIKGLVDNGRVSKAVELKEEMGVKGFAPDPVVYSYLMSGCVRSGDLDGVFGLFEELKEKLGGFVENGVVYGALVKGYFMKGMEKEAMQFYEEAVGEGSKVKMSAVAFNSLLDALNKNGKFELGLRLFDRMIEENRPPWCLTVNLGSFNVMVDGYCAQGRFKDAIEVFRKMGEYRCRPDILSFNNLIEQLCDNGLLGEAEEVYGEMSEKGVNPDEFTFVLLMDACFKADRADDAAGYYRKMVDSGLRPNLGVYNKLVDGLVKVGKVDDAKSFFDLMVNKLKMDVASYEFIMKALSEVGKLDEVLNVVDTMLDDDGVELTEELQEFVKGELRKEGREEDLGKLIEEKERQKAEAKAKEAEAAEAAKRSARAAVASLLPSKLFGNKDGETESAEANTNLIEATSVNEEVLSPGENASVNADGESKEEAGTNSVDSGGIEAKSDGTN